MIAARFQCAYLAFFITITGQSHQIETRPFRKRPQSFRRLKTIHALQSDVQQHHLGLEIRHQRQRFLTGRSDARIEAIQIQQYGRAFSNMMIIFNYQYSDACSNYANVLMG